MTAAYVVLVDGSRLAALEGVDVATVVGVNTVSDALVSVIALGAGGGVLVSGECGAATIRVRWPRTLGAARGDESIEVLTTIAELRLIAGREDATVELVGCVHWPAFPTVRSALDAAPGVVIRRWPLPQETNAARTTRRAMQREMVRGTLPSSDPTPKSAKPTSPDPAPPPRPTKPVPAMSPPTPRKRRPAPRPPSRLRRAGSMFGSFIFGAGIVVTSSLGLLAMVVLLPNWFRTELPEAVGDPGRRASLAAVLVVLVCAGVAILARDEGSHFSALMVLLIVPGLYGSGARIPVLEEGFVKIDGLMYPYLASLRGDPVPLDQLEVGDCGLSINWDERTLLRVPCSAPHSYEDAGPVEDGVCTSISEVATARAKGAGAEVRWWEDIERCFVVSDPVGSGRFEDHYITGSFTGP